MIYDRKTDALRDDAELYDAVCHVHRNPGEFHKDMWLNRLSKLEHAETVIDRPSGSQQVRGQFAVLEWLTVFFKSKIFCGSPKLSSSTRAISFPKRPLSKTSVLINPTLGAYQSTYLNRRPSRSREEL